jgi:hypothetical protein
MHARFAACAGRGALPWIEPSDCLRSVAAVEAAYRSLCSGAWEGVDLSVALPQAGRQTRHADTAAQIAS